MRFAENQINRVNGTVWQGTVCTVMEWEWLLFPGILVLCTTVALGLVMWVTGDGGENKAPVWKSSILPMLLSGDMKGQEGKQITVVERVGERWRIVGKGGV